MYLLIDHESILSVIFIQFFLTYNSNLTFRLRSNTLTLRKNIFERMTIL